MSEFSDLVEKGFQESLDALPDIDIIYRSRLQKCNASELKTKKSWQQVGFVEEITGHVDMLADAFNDFVLSGFNDDNQPIVTLNDTLFQVIEVDFDLDAPLVRLFLTLDK